MIRLIRFELTEALSRMAGYTPEWCGPEADDSVISRTGLRIVETGKRKLGRKAKNGKRRVRKRAAGKRTVRKKAARKRTVGKKAAGKRAVRKKAAGKKKAAIAFGKEWGDRD